MKRLAIVLAGALTLSCLAGCNGEKPSAADQSATVEVVEAKLDDAAETDAPAAEEPTFETELEKTLFEASKMTDEELYSHAKEEKEKTVVYSTTSLAANALETFLAKYPDLNVEISDVGEADMFTKLSTEIGSPFYAVLVWIVFHRLGWKRALILIAAVLIAFVLSDRISTLIKYAVGRLRPCYTTSMIEGGLHTPEGRGGFYGFFSSHASNAFMLIACVLTGLRADTTPHSGIKKEIFRDLMTYEHFYAGIFNDLGILIQPFLSFF